MTRYIYCRKCGEFYKDKGLPPKDRGRGLERRGKYIAVHAAPPAGHGITITTENYTVFTPMGDIVCDNCNDPILTGIAIAFTIWNKREGEVAPDWEHEYGTILPDEAVAVDDVLTDTKTKKGQNR